MQAKVKIQRNMLGEEVKYSPSSLGFEPQHLQESLALLALASGLLTLPLQTHKETG